MFSGIIILMVVAVLAGAGFMLAPKGWRTVVVNALMGGSLVIGQILDYLLVFDFGAVTTPANAAWAMLAVNVINIVLRTVTTSPLGKEI